MQPVSAEKARQQEADRRAALLDAQTERDFRELAKQVCCCLVALIACCMGKVHTQTQQMSIGAV